MNIEQVFLDSVGKSIVAARKAMNIPQKQFAEAMQVTVQTQAAYETGKREPSLIYLARMSTYTGRSIASILGEPLYFHNYADIIKCINTLDDIGVLKVRAIQLEGKENLCFDETITQYLDALDALKSDSEGPICAEASLLDFYSEKRAPSAGSGFDPSGAAQCEYAKVKGMPVQFGYIKDTPVIVREIHIDGEPHYNVLIPNGQGESVFVPALNIPVDKLAQKALVKLIPEKLHIMYEHIPAKTADFSLVACRAWEIDLPCLGNRTMVVSAFDRNAAPLTILLTTIACPETKYLNNIIIKNSKGERVTVTGEHDFFFMYVTRIHTPCRSEGKARQLVWRHGVVAPSLLGGPEENPRKCEHCCSGDGGHDYELYMQDEYIDKAETKKLFW